MNSENLKSSLKTIFFALAFVANTALAQDAGTITGTVLDPKGRPVENANVVVLNTSLGALSNAAGQFSINNIPYGDYSIKISALGFESQRQPVSINKSEVTLNAALTGEGVQLKEVTITSNGIKDDIKNIPGTVNVVDGQQIRESGAQSVGQIINRIPGVNYLDEDGRGLKPNIGLRGLDPLRNRNLLVLVDGKFPIGMTLYGDPAAYYMIPLQNVERVEVIKGASPVLYGGYSVGGVVNMITKRGEVIPETKIDIGYGSWNGLTAQISTGADKGKFNYYVSGLRRQGDGYRDQADYAVDDYTIRLGTQIDETSEFSLYLNYFNENSETPGGITQAMYDQDPQQSQHPVDEFYAKRFSAALSFKKTIGTNQTISTSLYGNYFVRDWWIAKTGTFVEGFLRDIAAIGNVTEYNLTKPIAGHENSLIVGVRLHTDRLDDIGIRNTSSITARSGATTGNKINTSFIYEGFIYDEFGITPNLTFAPGLRYTSVKYSRNDLAAASAAVDVDTAIVNDAFVYSGGLIYKIKEHSRVYATYSRGYQPPALNSVMAPGTINAGEDLQAETSENFEIGFRTAPYSWLALNVSAYRMLFDNKVVAVSGVNKNVGQSFHRGVEAELELGAWHGLSFFVNATVQKATFDNDVLMTTTGESAKGNILPNAPQRLAAAGIRYRLPLENHKIVFNVSHNYVGKQYSDIDNTEQGSDNGNIGAIPAYNVTNFTANYSYKNWGLYVNVNNVFDEKYFTLRWATWNGIIPSPGRNFVTGVTFKF
jgi:Fe(3+) dicitrate transport protein